MRLQEYAKLKGVTYQTAWNWFKAGHIPNAEQMPTGTIIINEEPKGETNNIMKFIGLHNGKKIIILRHKLPEENHMAMILFDDKLPPMYAEAIHNAVDSKEAQAGKELDEFLWSVVLPTGVRLWTELSAGGHIKKIQTNQIFVTPDTRNKIKLSDLNELLGKLEEGGEAAKKLADLDESKGMNRKKRPQVLAAEKILNEGANDEVAELRAQTKQLTETLDALMLEVRNLRRNSGQQVQEPVIKVVETAVESKKRGRKPSSSKE